MGLQITLGIFIAGYFVLLFDPTLDHGAAEGHTSHPQQWQYKDGSEIKQGIT
jgi:hypothetical protein